MDQPTSPRSSDRRPVGGDLIIPIAAIAFTLYYFSTILQSPWEAQVNAFFVGSILIVLVLLLLIRLGRAFYAGEAGLGLGEVVTPRAIMPKRLALLALTLGYIVVIEWAGFTLTTFAFLAAAMLLLSDGRCPGFILALAATLALGGWLLFVVAFDTRFPVGPFERLIALAF